MKRDLMQDLIRANGSMYYKTAGIDGLHEIIADLIVFGALELCPKCEHGQLRYR